MATLPTNLPTLLRDAGLKVVELDGWHARGRPASTGGFAPVGVLWHHTGDASNGKAYAEGILTKGRSDLPGPLCHLSIDRQGVVYLVAGGRANHAGEAKAAGSVAAGDGNTLYIGIEFQNTGTEYWTDAQHDSGITATVVLLKHVTKTTAQTVHAHYETSVTGKWDPGSATGIPFKGKRVVNMTKIRQLVASGLAAKPAPAKPVFPQVDKAGQALDAATTKRPKVKAAIDAAKKLLNPFRSKK